MVSGARTRRGLSTGGILQDCCSGRGAEQGMNHPVWGSDGHSRSGSGTGVRGVLPQGWWLCPALCSCRAEHRTSHRPPLTHIHRSDEDLPASRAHPSTLPLISLKKSIICTNGGVRLHLWVCGVHFSRVQGFGVFLSHCLLVMNVGFWKSKDPSANCDSSKDL